MFQLSNDEVQNLWSQVGTANINKKSRALPYVFTEQGITKLATILKTNTAKVSIA